MSEIRLGEGTRGRIIEEIALSPKTARDLARSLGIQESAARGHLERLEERGLVVPTFRREGVGRPRKRYLLTPQGQELFPRRYEQLLETLMEELLQKEGSPYVTELFAGAARAMALEVAREIPKGKSQQERARALASALNHLGFRCTTEVDPSGILTIVRTNCVFRHLAQAHSYLLCEVFDKNLTETLLGQSGVDLKDSITRGSLRCTHLVQLQ
ncbi:MAG: MarR family transcriptional regulator [Thermoplasmata archaeon]|nr:MarR family transcriptional regulator [Thermoplasmata archaeon]